MGRLDNILERNKHPGKHRPGGRFPWGLVTAAFVLLILVLMIFTDLDESPDKPADAPAVPTTRDPGEKHVDGVLLYRDKRPAARDAGSD